MLWSMVYCIHVSMAYGVWAVVYMGLTVMVVNSERFHFRTPIHHQCMYKQLPLCLSPPPTLSLSPSLYTVALVSACSS